MGNNLTKLLLVLTCFISQAQTNNIFTLSYHDYIKIVINEHPLVKQANIKIDEGEANLLYARGAFDPKLYADLNQKHFKGDEYYNKINSGLTIPTWFGVEVKGGYQKNNGSYLNPENNIPDNGLIFAEISVPVGQGLFIDKRRAELKKAKIFQQASELERQIMLNELIYNASLAYWKWFKYYNYMKVYENAYKLATERFNAIVLSTKVGDRPAIDTLEAGIQVQNRLLGLQQAKLEYKNSSAQLSIYLWEEGIVPLELREYTTPIEMQSVSALSPDIPFTEIDSLINRHPKIDQSRLIIEQLEIDRRFRKNQLLPIINLKYNPITEYIGSVESFGDFSIDNYTLGMKFQMPLFLRKERAALRLSNLKIQDYNLQLTNKRELLKYKALSEWNRWNTTIDQINLYAQTVDDTKALLDAEQRLFEMGESSLFLLNAREIKYIETQLKYIELLTKNKNSSLSLKYITGVLQNQ